MHIDLVKVLFQGNLKLRLWDYQVTLSEADETEKSVVTVVTMISPPDTREYGKPDEEWEMYHQRVRAAERAAIAMIFSILGLDPAAAKFSPKAGCNCGCSPGYVLSEGLYVNGQKIKMYITQISNHIEAAMWPERTSA